MSCLLIRRSLLQPDHVAKSMIAVLERFVQHQFVNQTVVRLLGNVLLAALVQEDNARVSNRKNHLEQNNENYSKSNDPTL